MNELLLSASREVGERAGKLWRMLAVVGLQTIDGREGLALGPLADLRYARWHR